MLTELNIRNFAIIDELKVTFDGGLNVISGETGAGKSIIIGAVGLLLGDRANTDMIRSFEDAAVVEALFDIRGQDGLREKIGELGFGDGEELIVRRVVSRSASSHASPTTRSHCRPRRRPCLRHMTPPWRATGTMSATPRSTTASA